MVLFLLAASAKLNGDSLPDISSEIEVSSASIENSLNEFIVDDFNYSGLASYYGGIQFFTVKNKEVTVLGEVQNVVIEKHQWFIAAGRFNVLAINSDSAELTVDHDAGQISLVNYDAPSTSAFLIEKPNLGSVAPELDKIRYVHLWYPIALIARTIEWGIVQIQLQASVSWGIAIVLFAIALKVIMLPLSLIQARLQASVNKTKSGIEPLLAEIKKKYNGEEAHNRIVEVHKNAGVSLFYALKPLSVSLFQIPILIAVFNALGEMPQLQEQSFLWINNLTYPDIVGTLPFSIPLLGSNISLLPFLMTSVSIGATLAFTDRHLSAKSNNHQKRNLYLMAIAFFILFYPFPSAMVLYWTLSNALQLIQQKLIKQPS